MPYGAHVPWLCSGYNGLVGRPMIGGPIACLGMIGPQLSHFCPHRKSYGYYR